MSTTLPSSEKSRRWPVLLVIVLLVLLGFAVASLFSLRFARGDIYPPYSSLRADPLGTKIIADALDELPGFNIQRSYRQLSRLKLKDPATIVYVGIDYQTAIDDREFKEAERLVKSGSRLVITFARELPRGAASTASTGATAASATPAPSATPTPVPATTPKPAGPGAKGKTFADGTQFHEAAEDWGVSFDRMEKNEAVHGDAVPKTGAAELDPSIPWHTALVFKDLDPAWQTLYQFDGHPVVIERPFGSGSIVLCTDSYFLSNEGMLSARALKLISRVIGPPRLVIFDEFHNGIAEHANVAGLARKYGLGGAIFALLGVAALFLWKNAIPFLPPQRPAHLGDSHVVGLDASAGFINLLRRGVPPNRLLAICVEEWRKSRGSRIRNEELAHIDSVMRAHEGRSAFKDAAAAYRTIAAGLKRPDHS